MNIKLNKINRKKNILYTFTLYTYLEHKGTYRTQ